MLVFSAREPGPFVSDQADHAVSALLRFLIGGDSNYALQVCQHTCCILLRGRIRQLLSKPTNPYSDASAPTMISAERWDGAATANEPFQQTGEVNKGPAPPPGEDAFGGGTQLNPGTLLSYNQALTTNRFSTPPQP